jgi:hypothetical protein
LWEDRIGGSSQGAAALAGADCTLSTSALPGGCKWDWTQEKRLLYSSVTQLRVLLIHRKLRLLQCICLQGAHVPNS